jgi:hypothetical protein
MAKVIKWFPLMLLVSALLGTAAQANTVTAASCNKSDVQSAINSASESDTVIIPAGTCSWTSGVTISGKGITVQGAGSGRIIAQTANTLTIATGTLTITDLTFSTGFSGSLTAGLTLRVSEEGGCGSPPANSNGPCGHNVSGRLNWMQGTVTSYDGGTLTMNVTSDQLCSAANCPPSGGVDGNGGTSTHRWLISTIPFTVIVNNSPSTALFSITEDSTFHTNISGIKVAHGTGGADAFVFGAGGGAAIVLQNCWVEQSTTVNPNTGGYGDSVHFFVNRGVVSNCSFDASPFAFMGGAIVGQPFDETAWATPSYWGALDTNGQHAFYAETSDFHAYLNMMDNDEGSRSVFRYNLFDHAGFGTHGADTGPIGSRYWEYYNNTGIFNGYSDGTTFGMNQWFYVRGGSFIIYNNILPAISSQDYGTKPDVNMTVMNLQRNNGPNPCWGQGTSGAADYYAPRQVGLGHVTGTGTDGKGRSTYSAASYGYSATEYVGDSEPAYTWANSRSPLNEVTSDYGTNGPNSCAVSPPTDTSANYIVLNRDYFNSSAAKPGYTPYTYPHPLTAGQGSGANSPPPPTGLSVVVQ